MRKGLLPLFALCIVHCASCMSPAAPAAAADAEDPADLKPWALECYGLRGAVALDAETVVAVFGASSTFSRAATNAWRVLSEDDPAYAYEKFVRPAAAEDVSAAIEFPHPEGFEAPEPATNELERFVVRLSMPTPLRPGARYGLVALSDERNVTGGKTGCWIEGPGADAPADPAAVRVPADARAARMVGLRRVSPLGAGLLALEFGASFSTAEWLDAAQYRVRFGGEEVPVREFGRRSKIDVYVPEGWPFHTFLQHDVYLDVGRDPRPGERVEVSVSPRICSGAREASFVFDPDATLSRSIHANQIGYLPDGPKVAYLGFWLASFPEKKKSAVLGFDGSTVPTAKEAFGSVAPPPSDDYDHLADCALRFREPPPFELVRESDGAVVFRGASALAHNGRRWDGRANHSAENVYTLDFSDFAEPGRYFLRVPGVGRSLAFDVAADVYLRPFRIQSAGVFAQRCGFELTPDRAPGWRRIACHTNGVVATTVKTWRKGGGMGPLRESPDPAVPEPIPLRGGHHDAGDYNPRSHLDVAQTLLAAWELAPRKFADGQLDIPEAGNGVPDIVDEALWALEAWIALQDADGGVRDGTESQGDPGFSQTVELDDKGDFAYAKSCKTTFEVAGAFAQASRALAACGKDERAAAFLERARRAYGWAVANVPEDLKDKAQFVAFRFSARALAAAELLHATGELAYLDDFRACVPWVENPKAAVDEYGRYDVFAAACAFARDPENATRDPELLESVRRAIERKANDYIKGSDRMAYKFIRHPNAPISWGTGCYGNFLRPVVAAWFLTGDAKYRDWTIRTCDNMLGANPLGLSWIVGAGERTIRAPLHNSRFRPEGVSVDGMQSEGPNGAGNGYNYKATVYPRHRDDFASLHSFVDAVFAIAMDEGMVSHQVLDMAVLGLLLPDAP